MFFKKKKVKNFVIPSAEECYKKAHEPEYLSVDMYKRMFNETKVKDIAVRLFNLMDGTYSRIDVYTHAHNKALKDAVQFWSSKEFPFEVLAAPWKEFLKKGWYVKLIIFHNDDYYNSINISVEITAKNDQNPFPFVEVIQGYE